MKEKFIINQPVDNFFKIRQLDKYMTGHKGYIAGGVFKDILSNKKVKDVDIFFEKAEDFEQARQHFSSDENFASRYENDKALGFMDKRNYVTVELIKHKYLKPLDMLNDFDFTITKFAYYKEEAPSVTEARGGIENRTIFEVQDVNDTQIEWKIAYHKRFFEHLHMKRLVIDNDVKDIVLPVNTFNRMFRYAGYGYFPCRETKVKIIEAIRQLPDFEKGMLSRELYNGVD